jgi:hypothetical protein
MRGRAVLSVILLFGAVIPFVAAAGGSGAAVKVPQWLLDEASRILPSFPEGTEAVVLLDDQKTVVTPKGVMRMTGRRAVKVLRPGGVDEARRLLLFDAYGVKVRSMDGWVVNPLGAPRHSNMKQAISSSLAPDTLYMDARMILIALPEVSAGSVVGFEWEEECDLESLEDGFHFQGRFPVLRARYSLDMPTGWKAEFLPVNWDRLEPRPDPASPQNLTVEVENIPGLAEEPFRPNEFALAGRAIVRLRGPLPDPRCFAGWPDMGAWYEKLCKERRVPDDEVAKKAASLAEGAPDTLGRIRALAEFVQRDIRYVSIQIGIGGFQPHSASSVLSNRYGDCKDKATLLAALLEAVGVPSCYVIINTDRGCVTPGSPVSLYGFNHAILAIRLPDDVPDAGLDGLVRHPRLGRLLIFDPTMPTTPVGRLPFYLQDNTGLLVAEGGSELVSLPLARPESNSIDRSGRLALTGEGFLSGEVQEVRRGAMADSLRYQMQSASETERRQYLETFLSNNLAAFSLNDYEFKNLDDPQRDLIVRYRFVAPGYAKKAGGYLVVRPRVAGQKSVDLTSREKRPRLHPVDLETTTLARDEFIIELPEGTAVENLPKPVAIEAGFAAYKSEVAVEGRALVYRREYRLGEPLLPASRFQEALDFFLAIGAEERQSVLLKTDGLKRRP